ncbi:hypothetical protein E5K00_09635 [Hymenobacter aquaticus]|uniref:NTR domain-containing protein n=1 Tax=Hymenobacter aquaticus TaxID=1867101 RepID=A0A4Z0Q5R9_9BACT|nr:hypothetical protein [Hymenobacter aquaticus]TGE25430.1 hypothetical protein E5K00_09635 [Hymenobacter aquaticus]
MLRSLLTWFLLLGSALAISACCVNNTCLCQDAYDDDVFLRFNLDVANGGFKPTEVDTLVLVRRIKDPKSSTRPDTVVIGRALANVAQPFSIGPSRPFTRSGVRFTQFIYTVALLHSERRFVVDPIEVESRFVDESACCTCSRNRKKTVVVNNVQYDAHDPTDQDQPVYITLSKQ